MKKVFIVCLIIIGLGLFVNYQSITTPTIKGAYNKTSNNGIKLVVFQKIGNISSEQPFIEYIVDEENTALDLLQKSNIVELQGSGQNAFITTINNVKADPNKKEFWGFYVNGKLSSVGAGSYQLKINDNIEWKINKY